MANSPHTATKPGPGIPTRHPDSWVPDSDLGRIIPPYLPTMRFEAFVNDHHRFYSECPVKERIFLDIGIPGMLRREDALKLYELAYFSEGDVLELGCFKGLSTSILAQAVADSGDDKSLTTVDAVLRYLLVARKNLTLRGVGGRVHMKWGDGARVCRRLADSGRTFGFAFVDHSHAYEDVAAACAYLPRLVNKGGFCLFHDFNDERNADPNEPDYGVSTAVRDHLGPAFEFYGVYGCTGLYRRVH